jgi:hypothetical protein
MEVDVEQPFEFLASRGFEKSEHVRNEISSWKTRDCRSFLEEYCLMSAARTLPDPAAPGSLSVLPDSCSSVDGPLLRQLALYLDRIYLHDPIPVLLYDELAARFAVPPSRTQKAAQDRRVRLAEILERVLELAPLAHAGVASLQPTMLAELADPPGALHGDDFFSPDGAPGRDPLEDQPHRDALAKYAAENVLVRPINPLTKRLLPIHRRLPAIALQIRGDLDATVRLQMTLLPETADDHTHSVSAILDPNSELDPESFRSWTETEAQKVILTRLRRLQRDVTLARFVGAALVTELSATHDLMPLAAGAPQAGGPQYIAPFLELQLPYFERATFASIAEARTNELAYAKFRSEMARAVRELAAIADPSERRLRATEILRDIVTIPLQEVKRANRRLRTALFANSAVTVGSLGSFVLAQATAQSSSSAGVLGGTALIALTSGLNGLKEYLKEHSATQDTPGYFYWRAAGKP